LRRARLRAFSQLLDCMLGVRNSSRVRNGDEDDN